MRTFALLLGCIFTAAACENATAALMSFKVGMSNFLGTAPSFGIQNTGTVAITSVKLDFSGVANNARFDTRDPGISGGSVPFSWGTVVGGVTLVGPSFASLSTSADNQSSVTFGFGGFDGGDSVTLRGDVDTTTPVNAFVNPTNALVTVNFLGGSTVSALVGLGSTTIGTDNFSFGGAATVPEPASLAVFGVMGGFLVGVRFRRKSA